NRIDAATGQMLLGRIFGVLVEEFAKEQKVEVTAEEIEASIAHSNRALEASRARWRARIAKLEADLAAGSIPAAREKEAREELASTRRVLESDTTAHDWEAKQSPAMVRRSEEEVTRSVLRSYKINQALYRVYGGRVI